MTQLDRLEALAGPNWPDDIDFVLEALPDLIRVARAAKKQRQAEEEMLSVVSISGHGNVESRAMTEWIDAGAEADDALHPLFAEVES